jgi:bifunctional non-homologous end joining protein LigD
VYLDGGRVRAASRNDHDAVAAYPELRTLLERFPRRRLILDGEIVALDPRGRPSFGLLQQRMHVRAPSAALLARMPVQLYVFVCAWVS